MTETQLSRAAYYFRSAVRIANEVEYSFSKNEFDRAVRKTQEAIELLLKGKLLEKGIEPAKTHDLRDLFDFIPQPLEATFAKVSMDDLVYLSEERIPSFYGGSDFIPDQIYDQNDGLRCVSILKMFGLLSNV